MLSNTVNDALESAETLAARLRQERSGLKIAATDRNWLSAACFDQAFEYHKAIILLVRQSLFGAALALVRPMFEIYIRGVWIGQCASDAELEKLRKDRIDKKFHQIMKEIESHDSGNISLRAKVTGNFKDAMNDFIHGGRLQLMRRLTGNAFTPNYPANEIVETIDFVSAICLLSEWELVLLAGRKDIATSLLDEMKARGIFAD